jgi:hypothetical protein
MGRTVAGITIPTTPAAQEAEGIVHGAAGEMLFNHSTRVFLFGALKGRRRGLAPDLELLYVAALFHDIGLTSPHAESSRQRFELDGADAARDFLLRHGRSEQDARRAWLAVALHTTPGIPAALEPEIALVTAGVETDVLGLDLGEISETDRAAVVEAYPRPDFKQRIARAFYDGMRRRPETTFGTMNDDVIAHFEPGFQRRDFVQIIESNAWPE